MSLLKLTVHGDSFQLLVGFSRLRFRFEDRDAVLSYCTPGDILFFGKFVICIVELCDDYVSDASYELWEADHLTTALPTEEASQGNGQRVVATNGVVQITQLRYDYSYGNPFTT